MGGIFHVWIDKVNAQSQAWQNQASLMHFAGSLPFEAWQRSYDLTVVVISMGHAESWTCLWSVPKIPAWQNTSAKKVANGSLTRLIRLTWGNHGRGWLDFQHGFWIPCFLKSAPCIWLMKWVLCIKLPCEYIYLLVKKLRVALYLIIKPYITLHPPPHWRVLFDVVPVERRKNTQNII